MDRASVTVSLGDKILRREFNMSEPPSRRAVGVVAQREIGSYGMSDPRLPDWPAGLSEPLAAKYLGISQTTLRGQIGRAHV